MGRGRAKAKQTKVARKLKYSSGDTDFDALRRELAGTPEAAARADADSDTDDADDEYGWDETDTDEAADSR